jgi:hypothetical protein
MGLCLALRAGVESADGDRDSGRDCGGGLLLPQWVVGLGDQGEVRADEVQGGGDHGGADQARVWGAVSRSAVVVMA